MRKARDNLFVAGLLIAMQIWGSLPVGATDVPVDSTSTGSTPTSFIATDDMLQNDVIVSIPADMILTYNSSTKKLTDSDIVTARGDIKAGKHLEVSVPTSITYQNKASSSIDVNGVLNFGSVFNNRGVEKWTPSQVSSSAGDSRQITSTVNAYDLEYAGTYKATITFNISIVSD